MRLAILFATKYGSTRIAAEAIARGCGDLGVEPEDIVVQDLRASADMPDADAVVIGTPIYGGSILRPVSRFAERHVDALLERRVALYLSCLYDGDRAEKQLADNFPSRLVAHAFGRYYVGGVVNMKRLGWIDRLIMKRVGGIDDDLDRTNPAEIGRLVDELVSGGQKGS